LLLIVQWKQLFLAKTVRLSYNKTTKMREETGLFIFALITYTATVRQNSETADTPFNH